MEKLTLYKIIHNIKSYLANLLPGISLCVFIALCAWFFRLFPFAEKLSPSIISVIIGIIISNTMKLPEIFDAGASFSSRSLVRFAVALLGFQISIAELIHFGIKNILITILVLSSSFVFIKIIGHILGVDKKLTELIAAGTSVCGAAAIAATNSVTKAHDEDVAYGIGMVTIFGTSAMLIYPILNNILGLGEYKFGLWAGMSIHEVAQVVGAASSSGAVALHISAISKLTRVLLLAPLIAVLQISKSSSDSKVKIAIPNFIIAFIGFILISNLISMPKYILKDINIASSFLLAMALGGMGLHIKFSKIRQKGLKPLLLSFLGAIFISSLSLFFIELV